MSTFSNPKLPPKENAMFKKMVVSWSERFLWAGHLLVFLPSCEEMF